MYYSTESQVGGLVRIAAGSVDSGLVKGVLNMANSSLTLGLRMPDRLMQDPPNRIERRRISGQAWDDVPVDVRELVAEEFIVDLLGIIDL